MLGLIRESVDKIRGTRIWWEREREEEMGESLKGLVRVFNFFLFKEEVACSSKGQMKRKRISADRREKTTILPGI